MTELENQIADEIIQKWADHCTELHAKGIIKAWMPSSREDVKAGNSWLYAFVWQALVDARRAAPEEKKSAISGAEESKK